MRLGYALLGILLSCSVLFATTHTSKKRLLVNGSGEVITVKKGQSAQDAVQSYKLTQKKLISTAGCTGQATFGWVEPIYPFNIYHTSTHKDVYGEWFTAPASGVIDSVFVYVGPLTGDPNNSGGTFGLRIFNSNVGWYSNTNTPFGIGPGYGGYPTPPETTCWGYYNSTSDLDNGVAAFPDDITGSDTAWHSKYVLNSDHKDTASFAPTRDELWGEGGWPINILHSTSSDTIVGVGMSDNPLQTATVTQGVPFFVSLKVPGNHPVGEGYDSAGVYGFTDLTTTYIGAHEDWTPAQINSTPDSVKLGDHVWKFYEHWFGHCQDYRDTTHIHGTFPAYKTEAGGWIARGFWNENIWYVLAPTSDVPPTFTSEDILHNTFSSASHVITCTTLDCNYAQGGHGPAGTASVDCVVIINDSTTQHIPMTALDNNTTWEVTIPGAHCGEVVRYQLNATDVNGNSALSPQLSYNVLCGANQWYTFDTTAAATPKNIVDIANNGGTAIDTSKFFNVAGGSASKDDGSAGPYYIGNFPWAGDTMHYAWVNVNGAIAISKTATDTIVANFGGAAIGGGAILPYPQRNKFRSDSTTNAGGIGRNFIAPMFCDLLLGDTTGQYGNIFTKWDSVNNKYIAEWAGVGDFSSLGGNADEDTFAVVLNDNLGTVEFDYYDVGINSPRLDSESVVGVEADSALPNAGYFQTNSWTYPFETKPRNNWTMTYVPTQVSTVADGWNMVSVPGNELNFAKTNLYPTSKSSAFAYSAGYVSTNTLAEGYGYWLKFSGNQTLYTPGAPTRSLTANVSNNWNMIGGVSSPVAVGSVTPSSGLTLGTFFGYSNGYSAVSSLLPGYGYWVKVAGGAGTISMTGSGKNAPKTSPVLAELSRMNSFTVRNTGKGSQTMYIGNEADLKSPIENYELPPAPPVGAFDARFSSNNMVETYPAVLDPAHEDAYVINLHSAVFPITLQYKVSNHDNVAFVLTDGNTGKLLGNTTLNGSGSVHIENAAITSLKLKVITSAGIPKTFALSQNYPNPFNPTTRMTVDVPQSGAVDVSVYDILGRKITTLLAGEQNAGSHTIEWNARDSRGLSVPSGAYFVRMTAGSFTSVKKMMLMK